MVALVAIMSGLCEVSFGTRQPERKCSDHLTTTTLLIVTTNIHVRESPVCDKRMKVPYYNLKYICKDSLSCVLRVSVYCGVK